MADRPPSHPGPEGSPGPQAIEVTAESLAGYRGEIDDEKTIDTTVGRDLGFDDELPTWDKASLFLVFGYDCEDYVTRFNEPDKGRFYAIAEAGVDPSEFDDRLAEFLRLHSFGSEGLDQGIMDTYGMIGQRDLDIVHFGAEKLKGTAYAPNVAAHNVVIVDLGDVSRENILTLHQFSPYRILDLSLPYSRPD